MRIAGLETAPALKIISPALKVSASVAHLVSSGGVIFANNMSVTTDTNSFCAVEDDAIYKHSSYDFEIWSSANYFRMPCEQLCEYTTRPVAVGQVRVVVQYTVDDNNLGGGTT